MVVCKGYKTCNCRDECDHSKSHVIITNSKIESENCVFNLSNRQKVLIDCCCRTSFLRKDKLDKINGL